MQNKPSSLRRQGPITLVLLAITILIVLFVMQTLNNPPVKEQREEIKKPAERIPEVKKPPEIIPAKIEPPKAAPKPIILPTDITLEVDARYYLASGDQVGRGPLPPEVGSETRYWIFWSIHNTTHDLSDVHVEATLPANVTFTGKQTVTQQSQLFYDELTGSISWRAPSIPALNTKDAPLYEVGFEVAITPTPKEIKTTPVLLSDIRLSARDTVTNTPVFKNHTSLTTSLVTDPHAYGKGEVITLPTTGGIDDTIIIDPGMGNAPQQEIAL